MCVKWGESRVSAACQQLPWRGSYRKKKGGWEELEIAPGNVGRAGTNFVR